MTPRRAAMGEAIRWRDTARTALVLWERTRWLGWVVVCLGAVKLAEIWVGIYWVHFRAHMRAQARG